MKCKNCKKQIDNDSIFCEYCGIKQKKYEDSNDSRKDDIVIKSSLSSHKEEKDELFDEAVKIVTQYDRVSASLLQRRLAIGYARAARLIDQLGQEGVLGEQEGAKPRDVLVKSYEEYIQNKSLVKKEITQTEDNQSLYVLNEYNLPNPEILSLPSQIPWGKPLKDLLKNNSYLEHKESYLIPFGYDENNQIITSDFTDLGHLIVVGNPMSEKMVFLDTLLCSILMTQLPRDLRFILCTSGHYLDLYKDVPHLLTPVISDNSKLESALHWLIYEVERRTKLCAEIGVRTIEEYNKNSGEKFPQPQIVLVITLGGFLMDNIQELISVLTSFGHRAGIHVVLVVDRMSDKELLPLTKSNIINRLVFQTTNSKDSLLAGVSGAEDLGRNEAILKTVKYPTGNKIQTIYTSEENVREVVLTIIKLALIQQ